MPSCSRSAGARARTPAPRRRTRRDHGDLRRRRRRRPCAAGSRSSRSRLDDGELVLRRVIGRDGRSRQYVNGQALPAQSVRALGELLIDIHGQQEFQSLVHRDAQREIVDDHGVDASLPARGRGARRRMAAVQRGARRTRGRGARPRRAARTAALPGRRARGARARPGEAEALVAERNRLANRGRLAESAQGALALLYEGDGADAHALAARAAGLLRGGGSLDARLAPALRLDRRSADRAARSRRRARRLPRRHWTPTRRGRTRSSGASRRSRTWRASTASTARGPARQARASCADSSRRSSSRNRRSAASMPASRTCARATTPLRRNSRDARRAAARKLAAAVTGLMRQLGMPGGRFEIAVETDAAAEPQPAGADRVEFLVSANPGEPAEAGRPRGLRRRTLAHQPRRPGRGRAAARARTCLIFDEVDAGIGGGVAEIVGRQAARARRPRPGALRDPPRAGREPGPSPAPRREADRRPHQPHVRDARSAPTSGSRNSRACWAASRSRARRASTRARC